MSRDSPTLDEIHGAGSDDADAAVAALEAALERADKAKVPPHIVIEAVNLAIGLHTKGIPVYHDGDWREDAILAFYATILKAASGERLRSEYEVGVYERRLDRMEDLKARWTAVRSMIAGLKDAYWNNNTKRVHDYVMALVGTLDEE